MPLSVASPTVQPPRPPAPGLCPCCRGSLSRRRRLLSPEEGRAWSSRNLSSRTSLAPMILCIGSVIARATQGGQCLTRETVAPPVLHLAGNQRAELVQCSASATNDKGSDLGEQPLPCFIDVTRPF